MRSKHSPRLFYIALSLLLLLGLVSVICACDRGDSTATDTAAEGQSTTEAPTAPENEDTTQGDTDMESENRNPAYTVTDKGGEDGLDFIIDFPSGKDLTVLQMTDTQMQTLKGVRNDNRRAQVGNAFFSSLPDNFEIRVWRYMDEAVEKSKPDLIVLTGDNIYGELDDSGEMWLALIRKMDSYKTPWCIVFGNHDNESAKGVRWQVAQLAESEYCIFRQGAVSGNSNYNLLVTQGGKAKYLFYMLDSNGCVTRPGNPGEGIMPDNVNIDLIQHEAGFRNDQIAWMSDSAQSVRTAYGEVPVLMFYHIVCSDAAEIIHQTYGQAVYQYPFTPDKEEDFGSAYASPYGAACGQFWKRAKSIGCIGMFVGHQHRIATSINCDGIRVTYGLKTGTYDSHNQELLGSTRIILSETTGEMTVEYVLTELPYRARR